MQRIIASFRQALIGGDGEEHVRRLHADLEFEKVIVLENADMVERALDHRLGAWLAVFLEQLAFERTGIDADTHGAAMVARRLYPVPHPWQIGRGSWRERRGQN